MRKNEEENNKLYGGNSQQSDMYNKGTKLLGFLRELWIII
jgi:hypothetical protein